MNYFNKIFQAFIDTIIGTAIFFVLVAFLPNVSVYVIALLALVITALFAEFLEIRLKN